MKKTIAIFAGAMMAFAASAKTWENFVNVGARIPCNPLNLEVENDSSKVKISPIAGIDLGYTGVHENGFSIRAIFDYTYAGSDINIDNDDLDGGTISFLIGGGYAPIHDEKMLLGIYGLLGANWILFNRSDETFYPNGDTIKYDYEYNFFLPAMGVNGTFLYTFSRSFSVYGSMTAEIILPGKIERKINSSSIKTDLEPSFLVVPALGVSWKF